jgi:hypothetical protein
LGVGWTSLSVVVAACEDGQGCPSYNELDFRT